MTCNNDEEIDRGAESKPLTKTFFASLFKTKVQKHPL